ncbi:MAG: flgK [Caulobacter sp.]|nr:flgK [Caulobacter sp.]
MSLSSIMNSAQTGLMAAQTGLRVVSDNIANVNTPGYVRKQVIQEALVPAGMSAGVNITGIRRAADAFLQKAAMGATADAAQAGAVSDMLDRAQALFGDPSEDSGFFNALDKVFSAFSAASDDPASSLRRSQALDSLSTFFSDSNRISDSLRDLTTEADTRITSDVSQVNDLLQRIDDLNGDIARAKSAGLDSAGSENVQSALVNDLSKLMNVKVGELPQGGVVIRNNDGLALSGQGAAKITYVRQPGSPGDITVTLPGGANPQPIRLKIASGEIKGLLDLRDVQLPGIGEQLGEFVTQTANAVNKAHNAGSAVPAPNVLNGRNTGLDLTSAVSGFTGKTTVALVDASGVIQQRVDIDFDAQTFSVNGGAASGYSPATFDTDLSAALGAPGSATFSGGVLTLSAPAGQGVSIADDPTTPSSKAGKGFSQYMGLNDLVTSGALPYYETGLTAADPHGFNPGDNLVLRISDASGARLRDVTIQMPVAATMQDLLNALNAPAGGVGLYGQFGLDANGAMSFTPSTGTGAMVSVVSDATQRGAGGPSVSALFGIGAAVRAARAGSFSVRADIAASPGNLSLASLNLSATAGTPALAVGDPTNAFKLAAVGDAITRFGAAGSLGATTATVSSYAAALAGAIGRAAAGADQQKTSAEAVSTEATNRRSAAEGVNLDEELVSMTTYQQAFNASARLISAAKDMYDALLAIAN